MSVRGTIAVVAPDPHYMNGLPVTHVDPGQVVVILSENPDWSNDYLVRVSRSNGGYRAWIGSKSVYLSILQLTDEEIEEFTGDSRNSV